ncbi:MAG: division/cell wall cluster transcriptional repressor MraZ [Planctomycetes bacterium]|nr:division/cell wall cluster transcriptional repressor MraZ [Planctomycetota bacterium]
MLITGTFARSLDEKLRIAIPKRLRAALAAQEDGVLYIAPGTDGSLGLYTEESFERLAERLAQASPAGQDVRAFTRLLYARAQPVELDRQGRLRIPAELAQWARLTKEIVLVGARDHLEIWNTPQWEEYLSKKEARYDEIAEAALNGPH